MEKLMKRVLEAKEERSEFQKEFIARHQLPIISLTLNLPGGYELYSDWEKVFRIASKAINIAFEGSVKHKHRRIGKWGPEGFWAIGMSAMLVKMKTVEIENKHPMGRIFDIDVLDENGKVLSRRDLFMEGRQCMVCDDFALLCYREKKHDYAEVRKSAEKIILKGLIDNE